MAKSWCEEICRWGFKGDPWNQNDKDQIEIFLKAMFTQLKAQLDTKRKCLLWRAALAFRTNAILVAYSHLCSLCECPGREQVEEDLNDSIIGELSSEELGYWLDYCTGEFGKTRR